MLRPILLVLALLGVAYVVTTEVETYSDKFDHVDAVAILANDLIREQYYECFMDTGPCLTDDAAFFKSHMAEAMVTKCKKCTNRQMEMFDQIVDWYTTNQEQKWNDLVAKCLDDAKKQKIEGARK